MGDGQLGRWRPGRWRGEAALVSPRGLRNGVGAGRRHAEAAPTQGNEGFPRTSFRGPWLCQVLVSPETCMSTLPSQYQRPRAGNGNGLDLDPPVFPPSSLTCGSCRDQAARVQCERFSRSSGVDPRGSRHRKGQLAAVQGQGPGLTAPCLQPAPHPEPATQGAR